MDVPPKNDEIKQDEVVDKVLKAMLNTSPPKKRKSKKKKTKKK